MGRKKAVTKLDNIGQKKLFICLISGFVIFLLLIIRIAFIQFVQGADLKEQAVKNQLSTKTIAANRGTIFDTTGKALAVSAHVDTITVNPSKIEYRDGTEVNKDFLAHSFSDIFDLDYDETLEKLNTKTKSFILASKVENDKVTALQSWMESNKIYSGISIDDDIKRFYPYNNLASTLIGFTGTENSGLAGLECTLNDILAGTPR